MVRVGAGRRAALAGGRPTLYSIYVYVLRCQFDWWETTRLTRCVVDAGSPVIMTRAKSPSPGAHGHAVLSRCYVLSLQPLTRYSRPPPHASVRRLRGVRKAFPIANRCCGAACLR